ncbi:TonB-dependent receptor [Methylomonas sp. UP202]|uniref:TonB-dependent siderophore receptor n=1 Tax=Methylomonas sp. UP202 TaxID=3040943 RepID=UPI00247A5F60|nr:TonB-dependent receptor [Methylomonas sp. UP202]WGS84200.1 TonB-dependent receptor [Methylomonas sp. UP202]
MSNAKHCKPFSAGNGRRHVAKAALLAVLISQTAHGDAAGKHHFDIPAQSLNQALLMFGRQSQQQLMYGTDIADNLRSRALQGDYTADEAIRILLGDAPLQAVTTGDGAITLQPRAAELHNNLGPQTMPAVQVVGKATYDSTDPYNPDYSLPNASTATKTDTPIMETPLSIQVVTKAVMHDQQAIQVGDAIKNVSGVFQGFTFGGFSEQFMIRGFNTNYANYVDGMRWPVSRVPLANAEKIEVVKGAAANLYGRIEPGGMINVVTKRPQEKPYYSLEQRFGSYDLYQTLADSTGAINQEGSLLYRINFEYLDKNSFRDFAFTERTYVAPSLTWKISDRTQLDLDFIYSNEDTLEDHGVVASSVTRRPLDIPISRYLGEPSIDKSNTELFSTGLTLNHEISENWKVNAQFKHINRDVLDLQHAAPGIINIATGELARAFCCGPGTQDVLGGILNITGKFATWDIKHSVLVGWDYYEMRSSFNGWFLPPAIFDGQVNSINIYNPQYGQSGVDLASIPKNDFSDQRLSWNGVYFQDQMTLFEKLHILGGGRYDWANRGSGSSSVSLSDATSSYSDIENQKFSPRVGLLYQPWQWLSLYGNFVESLGASNTSPGVGGNILAPESAEQFEAGFKTEFLNKRLNSSVAFYQLTKQNISVPIAGTRFAQTIGEARSRGVEIDISGQVADGLNLIATYAYTDANILSGDNAGNRLWNIPRNSGSLWAKYDIQESALHGLSVGAGVYFQSERQGDNSNSFQLPGYGKVDALLIYQLPIVKAKTTLQFNVENLLDHKYYSATDNSNSFLNPGAPRTFIGSVKVEY